MKTVDKFSDIPAHEHYAAIVVDSTYVPGDQRSIEAPGHGYPAHYETSIKYIVFDDEGEMKRWVAREKEHHSPCKFQIIRATGVKIRTEIVVELGG